MIPEAHQSDTDEMLARQVQGGDTEVFGVLVERYEKKLLRYGKKFLSTHEDIEDIVQEVFIRAFQNIQSFDGGQRFSPWLYRIAHNALVDGLKKKATSPFITLDFDTLLAYQAYDDPGDTEANEKEMHAMIEQGLARLDAKYREVLILYYLENLSYKEIAEVLQVPQNTVGIRIKRAKESLRKIYDAMNVTYEPHA